MISRNVNNQKKKKGSRREEIDLRAVDWLERYLEYRKRHPVEPDMVNPSVFGLDTRGLERFESVRHPLYLLLLHSGLIYGFPFIYPFSPAPSQQLRGQEIIRLALIDMLTFSVLRQFESSGADHGDYGAQLDRAAGLIRVYFRGMEPYAGTRHVDTLGELLSRHITFRNTWLDWRRSGVNCHLFWDWYFFARFVKLTGQGTEVTPGLFEELARDRKAMKLLTMKLIAAAAHSDHKIQLGERVLQHHFQRSAHFFSEAERAAIKRDFREGVDLEKIDLPRVAWMGRRYWLDISLMTIFADNEIQEAEEQYLQRLLARLELDEDDLLESKLALGGFLLRYGRRLPFFNSRKASVRLITNALAENVKNLREATKGEYKETVEMANIFGRLLQHRFGLGKSGQLPTEEEIAFALEQLKDLPKFLPFFSILFIPVPGITEMYIVLAYTIERLTGNHIRLLPSHFSKMIKKK